MEQEFLSISFVPGHVSYCQLIKSCTFFFIITNNAIFIL